MKDSKIYLKNVEIKPKIFKVRSKVSFHLNFSLNVDLPYLSKIIFRLRGGRNNKNDWYFLQTEDFNKMGYVNLGTTPDNYLLPFITTGKQLTVRHMVLNPSGIKNGTEFQYFISNTLVQSMAEKKKKIEILIQIENNEQILTQEIPTLEIVHNDFNKIIIIVPSIVDKSEKFSIFIKICDEFGNTVKNFEGDIDLCVKSLNNKRLPIGKINIQRKDKGVKEVDDIQIEAKGIFKIIAKYRKESFFSNPGLCEENPKKRIYWGFLHGHTIKSDGMLTLNEYFQNLIDAGLDFGTNTEHDRTWETSDLDFIEIKRKIKEVNKNGKILGLFGYEWGTWYSRFGDICIYHKDNSIPIFRSEINKYNSISKLIKNLQKFKEKIMMISHHTALRPGFRDWRWFDGNIERLVEIYSCWGNQEYSFYDGNPLPPRYKFFGLGKYARKRGAILEKKGSFIQDALAKGYKVGFTAGGDDHYGIYPSGPNDPDNGIYPSGIMAVWAPKLDKKNLWESLYSRNCYGTTGPRLIIRFSINDYEMGSIIDISNQKSIVRMRNITFKVVSPIIIKKVHLIRNNKVYKELFIEKKVLVISINDKEIFSDLCFLDTEETEKILFYYLRIFLTDNQMAWSSPIWIVTKN